MLKKKMLMSWSSGKDSAYALHKIRQSDEYEVVGLLSTVTEEYDRVAMHATRRELLEQQAHRLNLPLYILSIPSPCTNEIYEYRMHLLLEQAVNQGITHVAFGDLFLEDIRKYREIKLAMIGMHALFPLWKRDTTLLAHEMIDAGMKAIITCVDPKQLDPLFAGRQFDKSLLNDLPVEVDPCGEQGEFHTFVYDGPMFSSAIPISLGIILERDNFIFADVLAE
ncbi:MAG: adenine nucleotide alpha hydrolase [Gammaproteobacteria bacterium]|nr:adenine nucleotide alpha hydrolase [Gammaproteobacteria bacterium]